MPVIGAPILTVRLISLAKIGTKFKYAHVHYNTCVTDIDECNIPMFCVESDNRICNNTIGSYKCNCKDGYQENKTSNSCEGWLCDCYRCSEVINNYHCRYKRMSGSYAELLFQANSK